MDKKALRIFANELRATAGMNKMSAVDPEDLKKIQTSVNQEELKNLFRQYRKNFKAEETFLKNPAVPNYIVDKLSESPSMFVRERAERIKVSPDYQVKEDAVEADKQEKIQVREESKRQRSEDKRQQRYEQRMNNRGMRYRPTIYDIQQRIKDRYEGNEEELMMDPDYIATLTEPNDPESGWGYDDD